MSFSDSAIGLRLLACVVVFNHLAFVLSALETVNADSLAYVQFQLNSLVMIVTKYRLDNTDIVNSECEKDVSPD